MPSTKTPSVLLAFSGGLDTSYCAVYLKSLGYDVHAITIDVGGFSPQDRIEIERKAEQFDVVSYKWLNIETHFYNKCIRYLIAGNILKNNTYPLSVSAERVFQATAIAEYANEVGVDAIAHGSTGAGNDQVRFDMVFRILCPDKKILTPIRDQQLSREAEVSFLEEHGVQGSWSQAQYSINKGLWGTSVGGSETLTSHLSLPESAYPSTANEEKSTDLIVTFEKGEPIAINEERMPPVDCIKALNDIGSAYAIGRDTHVGDTIIGIKGRVGFEAPASLMLIKAHHLLEKHTLSKEQIMIKDTLSLHYGQWLHEGHYLEPAMRDIEAMYEGTQKYVGGDVYLTLHPYWFEVKGVKSEHDLMQVTGAQYGEAQGSWTGQDVRGFSTIESNATMNYYKAHPDAMNTVHSDENK